MAFKKECAFAESGHGRLRIKQLHLMKAGSVNGVPLKKRNGRTEEYEGDFLLDIGF